MSDGKYGVEKSDEGNVQIHLGPAQPFEITPHEAIKLAALLLKYAGASVKFLPDAIIAKFSSKLTKNISN